CSGCHQAFRCRRNRDAVQSVSGVVDTQRCQKGRAVRRSTMIPVDFHYHAPASLDEALDLLAKAGDEGQVLAGGQSLIPVLKLRMAAPETLVDLGRVPELTGGADDGDARAIEPPPSQAANA